MNRDYVGILIFGAVLVLLAAGAYYYFFGFDRSTNSVSTPSGSTGNTNSTEWKTYANEELAFSISYRSDFPLDESYTYDLLGSGKELSGVSFTVPQSFVQGTNLSADTKLSVEVAKNSASCRDQDFLETIQSRERVDEEGAVYDVLRGGGAAAGNLYEEIVYRLPNCYAIRYFIHTTNIGNYPAGTVREHDRRQLFEIFDRMRHSYEAYFKG